MVGQEVHLIKMSVTLIIPVSHSWNEIKYFEAFDYFCFTEYLDFNRSCEGLRLFCVRLLLVVSESFAFRIRTLKRMSICQSHFAVP